MFQLTSSEPPVQPRFGVLIRASIDKALFSLLIKSTNEAYVYLILFIVRRIAFDANSPPPPPHHGVVEPTYCCRGLLYRGDNEHSGWAEDLATANNQLQLWDAIRFLRDLVLAEVASPPSPYNWSCVDCSRGRSKREAHFGTDTTIANPVFSSKREKSFSLSSTACAFSSYSFVFLFTPYTLFPRGRIICSVQFFDLRGSRRRSPHVGVPVPCR